MLHRINIPKEISNDVLCEVKSFCVCKNDDDFKVGDRVIFTAISDGKPVDHKINEAMFIITYVENLDKLKQGYIAFSVRRA